MNPQAKRLSTMEGQEVAQLYKNVFTTVEGLLVLEDLRQRSYAYLPEDHMAATDRDVFVNIGKRSVVLHIETQLSMEPEQKEEGK